MKRLSNWTATDRGYIDEIVSALKVLGKEKMICYADEIHWLKQLRKRTEEDYEQQVRIQAAITIAGRAVFKFAEKVPTQEEYEKVAKSCVQFADAMVKALKGGNDE